MTGILTVDCKHSRGPVTSHHGQGILMRPTSPEQLLMVAEGNGMSSLWYGHRGRGEAKWEDSVQREIKGVVDSNASVRVCMCV